MFLLKHERRRGGNISYAICGVPCSETAKDQKSKKQQKISFASPPNIKMCII